MATERLSFSRVHPPAIPVATLDKLIKRMHLNDVLRLVVAAEDMAALHGASAPVHAPRAAVATASTVRPLRAR